MIFLYINCKLFPFIDWIINHVKTIETRNRNTLHRLVGKTVYLVETGTQKKPLVRCSCEISEHMKITDIDTYNTFRNDTMIQSGSVFDWKAETKVKHFYRLVNVQEIKPFYLPENIIRHSRIFAELVD